MDEYLLDTNAVIGLWNKYPLVIDKLIEESRIKILREVAEELVVKERRGYKGQQVLSERFCRLIFFITEVDRSGVKKFHSMLDIKYSQKGNVYLDDTNKLSEIDLLLLSACYINNDFILVTEDKYLFNATKNIFGEDRVMTLNMLLENEI